MRTQSGDRQEPPPADEPGDARPGPLLRWAAIVAVAVIALVAVLVLILTLAAIVDRA